MKVRFIIGAAFLVLAVTMIWASLRISGLEATKRLASMRDSESVLPHDVIALCLRMGTEAFADAVGQRSLLAIPYGITLAKNSDISAQAWRHFGARPPTPPVVNT